MKLLTWNINSLRLRLPQLPGLLDATGADVLCFQETKVVDNQFPAQALADLGFVHQAIAGMKSYNGVAIVSRLPLSEITVQERCGQRDCRDIAATVGGVRVHSLYIPAGGDIPDPEQNPKFAHKLAFLDEMTNWLGQTYARTDKVLLAGDFNIAPLEADVWSHKQLLTVVSHTPVEVDRLARMQASLDWVDAVRHLHPAPEKLFSWWSYRAADWKASNRGRRLDHIWLSPGLAPQLQAATILPETRDWTPPSDHAPVLVTLSDGG